MYARINECLALRVSIVSTVRGAQECKYDIGIPLMLTAQPFHVLFHRHDTWLTSSLSGERGDCLHCGGKETSMLP